MNTFWSKGFDKFWSGGIGTYWAKKKSYKKIDKIPNDF